MIIKKLNNNTPTPKYATRGSAGFDLVSNESKVIFSGEYDLVKTGQFFKIPQGYELQIRPRSGLALKHGVTVLNAPGTIDSDYTGEICVILLNYGRKPFDIQKGDRIAQAVVSKIYQAGFEIVDKLEETDRGNGGFGSTGV